MGIKLNLGRGILGLSLLIGGAGAIAAPVEPLLVIRLGDPELNLETSAVTGEIDSRSRERSIHAFGLAVGEAVRAQQQEMAARCRSGQMPAGTGAARWAWEANCRYRRR